LIGAVIVLGLVAAGMSLWGILHEPQPPSPLRIAAAAAVAFAGDLSLMHVRFGHNRYSFTWSEASVVIGLVLIPPEWLPAVGAAAIAVQQVAARRALRKVAFNSASFAVGAVLAWLTYWAVAGQPQVQLPLTPRTTVALAAGAIAYFIWNTVTVTAAVAFAHSVPVSSVYHKGSRLRLLIFAGNTAVGLLVVLVNNLHLSTVTLLPIFLILLYLGYRAYLKAQQERDIWQQLQAASYDFNQTNVTAVGKAVLAHACSLFAAEYVELLLLPEEPVWSTRAFRVAPPRPVEELRGPPLNVSPWIRPQQRHPFTVDRASCRPAEAREFDRHRLATAVIAPMRNQERPLGALCLGFRGRVKMTRPELQVLGTFAHQVAASVENARLFAVADALQRVVLPERLPETPSLSLCARYVPATEGLEVSGDWYDAFPLLPDRMALAIGDVAGHGLSAAALMAQLRNALRAYAIEGRGPAHVLSSLHRLLDRLEEPEALATVLYAEYDTATRRLRWASAGHLPPVYVALGQPAVLMDTETDPPLGAPLQERVRAFSEHEIAMPPDTCLVCYTDGLVERRGESLEVGLTSLLRSVTDASHTTASLDELCSHIIATELGATGSQDDVCLLVAQAR